MRDGAGRGRGRPSVPSESGGHGTDCARRWFVRRPRIAACRARTRSAAAHRGAGCLARCRADERPLRYRRSRTPLSRQRCRGRRGPRGTRTMTWSRTSPTTHVSWTCAPVMPAATGTPRPSVKMCRVTPRFARSVGFGPVWSPLWAPSPWRYPTTSTPTGCRGGRRSRAPTARRPARTPVPGHTVETEGDTSSPT